MKNMNDGGSAFPQMAWEWSGDEIGHYTEGGMSLRDWFAGQALAGIINKIGYSASALAACMAYEIADAMIAAREGKAE